MNQDYKTFCKNYCHIWFYDLRFLVLGVQFILLLHGHAVNEFTFLVFLDCDLWIALFQKCTIRIQFPIQRFQKTHSGSGINQNPDPDPKPKKNTIHNPDPRYWLVSYMQKVLNSDDSAKESNYAAKLHTYLCCKIVFLSCKTKS